MVFLLFVESIKIVSGRPPLDPRQRLDEFRVRGLSGDGRGPVCELDADLRDDLLV